MEFDLFSNLKLYGLIFAAILAIFNLDLIFLLLFDKKNKKKTHTRVCVYVSIQKKIQYIKRYLYFTTYSFMWTHNLFVASHTIVRWLKRTGNTLLN